MKGRQGVGYLRREFMKTIIQSLGAAALALALGSAHAGTALRLESDAGDYIGQGQKKTFSAPAWSLSSYGSNSVLHVGVTGDTWWYLDFASPSAQTLSPGRYAGATRYPFNSPTGPGLNVDGDGRGCNRLIGWFEVLEYKLDAQGNPAKAAINFKQNCEGSSAALYGALRINSALPAKVPTLRASAGIDQEAIQGDEISLDGSISFNRGGTDISYQWQQLAGPAVELSNGDTPWPSFTAPAVAAGGETLRFKLTVSNSSGSTDSDEMSILVHAADDPVTLVRFSGPGGDYISQGREYSFLPSNASMHFSRNYDGGVGVFIQGDAWWNLNFAPARGTAFTARNYPNAQRFPFQDAGHPGLDVSGDGRGCNMLTGKFKVYEAQFDADNTPTKLAIDFEQHCEGTAPALTGKLRLNMPVNLGPVAEAGPDQTVSSAKRKVILDGSASRAITGKLVKYSWRQIGGPRVTIENADQVQASFNAPLVLIKPQTLSFELTVQDNRGQKSSDTVDITVRPLAPLLK